jgi:hypothetical protein
MMDDDVVVVVVVVAERLTYLSHDESAYIHPYSLENYLTVGPNSKMIKTKHVNGLFPLLCASGYQVYVT